MNPYVIIGTPKCSYCNQAKSLLMDKYSDYEYYDLNKNPWIKHLFGMSDLKTVPQVFSPEGHLIGGYEDLEVHLSIMGSK